MTADATKIPNIMIASIKAAKIFGAFSITFPPLPPACTTSVAVVIKDMARIRKK
jgi:hypothetical protein